MVKLKVRRFGNSLGVVLPKEVVARLHTKDGEPLFLTEAPDCSYMLTSYDPNFGVKLAKAEKSLTVIATHSMSCQVTDFDPLSG